MSQALTSLDSITIASPCTASWENMKGDVQTRFCNQCQMHVYNVSEMNRQEALELIRCTEGRLCVRLYRRADGTILTQDCPVGLRAALHHGRRGLKFLAAGLAMMISFVGCWTALGPEHIYRHRSLRDIEPIRSMRDIEPFASILEWLEPTPPITDIMLGKMSFVPPPRDKNE